jgi:hypothetical protein
MQATARASVVSHNAGTDIHTVHYDEGWRDDDGGGRAERERGRIGCGIQSVAPGDSNQHARDYCLLNTSGEVTAYRNRLNKNRLIHQIDKVKPMFHHHHHHHHHHHLMLI